jgi:hypothetical protein
MNNTDLEKAINDSGFPLQLGIRQLLQSAGTRWRLSLWEHPWRDPASGDEKFVDMALIDDAGQTLVVECKRARDTEWIFLREESGGQHDSRLAVRVFVTAVREGKQPQAHEWCSVPHIPGTPIASFCVVRKNGQRSQELLERTAAEVVRATEAIARQELLLFKSNKKRLSRIYTPIVVTTARLLLGDVDFSKFDVEKGEAAGSSFVELPFIRFTKSLSVPEKFVDANALSEIADQAERSVVIVSASALVRFLSKWEVTRNIGSMADALWGA